MKITKLLPLALASVLLACPAFALDSVTTATSQMNLNLKKFVRVSTANTNITSVADYDAEYKTLTLEALAPTFHIVTNDPMQIITVTAKTKSGSKDALYKIAGPASGYAIAFANTTQIPDDTAIENLTGGETPSIANNADVIGVGITAMTLTPSATYGGATRDAGATNLNSRVYNIEEGTYDLAFTLDTTQMDGTFSTHDSYGTYTTSLILTATSGS